MSVPRGIACNNPCNIEYSPANAWQGRMPAGQRTGAQAVEKRFEVFVAPEWGIRAAAILIMSYFDRYGLVTVHDVINRWAPASENDTASYVGAVARRMGVMAHQVLDLHDYAIMKAMITAMIWQENGMQPYPDALLDRGLAMAGFVRPQSPVGQSGTVIGGAVATAAAGGNAIIDSMDSVRYSLMPLGGFRWVQYALIALTVAGAVVAIVAAIRQHPRVV